MDTTSAINRIQALWLTISGVRAAPNEPPERADPLPIAITYERTGTLDIAQMYSGKFAPQTGTIWSELHCSRATLNLGIRAAMSFRNSILDALRDDPSLGSNVMILTMIRWTLMPMQWAGIDTIGYRFELDYSLELTQ